MSLQIGVAAVVAFAFAMLMADAQAPARAEGTRAVSGRPTTVSVTVLPRSAPSAAANAPASARAGTYMVLFSRQGPIVTRHIYY